MSKIPKEKCFFLFTITFYLIVNELFIYKYGIRVEKFPVSILILGYLFLISTFVYFLKRINFSNKIYRQLFFVAVASFAVYTVTVNISIDGNTLNADRWSALHVGIESLLNGEYPYNKLDHLGNRTSNLPGLSILGLPFYLLGDVGFLQTASFLFFAFTLNFIHREYKANLLVLLLLILSPSYHWAIFAKSDLISNFIVVSSSLLLLQWFSKNNTKHAILNGFISAFLLLTRLTAIIPLILFNGKKFFQFNLKNKIIFLLVGISTIAIMLFLAFMNYPDMETLTTKNPFLLQNRQLPLPLSIITILLPFLLMFKIKDLQSFSKYAFLLIALPVTLSSIIKWYNNDFEYVINNINSDISYFNIVLPFSLYFLLFVFNNSEKTKPEIT